MEIKIDESATSTTINGRTVNGSMSIVGRDVYINGKKQENDPLAIERNINIVITGNVTKVDTMSADVTVNGAVTTIKTMSGDVLVHGDVGQAQTMSGDITSRG